MKYFNSLGFCLHGDGFCDCWPVVCSLIQKVSHFLFLLQAAKNVCHFSRHSSYDVLEQLVVLSLICNTLILFSTFLQHGRDSSFLWCKSFVIKKCSAVLNEYNNPNLPKFLLRNIVSFLSFLLYLILFARTSFGCLDSRLFDILNCPLLSRFHRYWGLFGVLPSINYYFRVFAHELQFKRKKKSALAKFLIIFCSSSAMFLAFFNLFFALDFPAQ